MIRPANATSNIRSWNSSEYVTMSTTSLHRDGGNNRQPLARLRLLKVYQNSTKAASPSCKPTQHSEERV